VKLSTLRAVGKENMCRTLEMDLPLKQMSYDIFTGSKFIILSFLSKVMVK